MDILKVKVNNEWVAIPSITGQRGIGIQSITKTNTQGLVDTYTILFSDGNSTTFNISNGAVPSFTIGTVTEGPTAAVTVTGTDTNPVLNLTLPNANVPTKVSELQNDSGYATTTEVNEAITAVNTMKIHICTAQEYNSETGVPTIQNPDTQTFYLVPGGEGSNLFIEWAYVNGAWERFGSADIDLSGYATKADTVLDTTLSRGRMANTTVGTGSFAFGLNVEASGPYSYAEGSGTSSSNNSSHAEGISTSASGICSHAEGIANIASGDYSHVEGYRSSALGSGSHAEGCRTIASGNYTHAAGKYNVEDSYTSWPEWESGEYAVGDKCKVTTTVDNETTVTGYVCKTANSDATFDASHWTVDTYMNFAEIIGNGTGTNARSNARALDWEGNEYLAGDVYVGANTDSSGGTKLAKITDIPVTDVQINGTSILSSGVANIPIASGSVSGVIKLNEAFGIYNSLGYAVIKTADSTEIKAGTNSFKPIVPIHQHESIFYGLSKIAGVDLANETVTLGTYPEASKTAIRSMIGAASTTTVAEMNAALALKMSAVFDGDGLVITSATSFAEGGTF